MQVIYKLSVLLVWLELPSLPVWQELPRAASVVLLELPAPPEPSSCLHC